MPQRVAGVGEPSVDGWVLCRLAIPGQLQEEGRAWLLGQRQRLLLLEAECGAGLHLPGGWLSGGKENPPAPLTALALS